MNESHFGKVFLFAMPWDWTYVGRFMGFSGDLMILEDSGYFTRPGLTFDLLCVQGFTAETQFHPIKYHLVHGHPNQVIPWEAAWPQPQRGR